jgi:putative transposase
MPAKLTSAVSGIALFRFSVVSEVRVRVARGQVRVDAIQSTVRHLHIGPTGRPRRVGLRSVYRWLAAYEAHGLPGLEDKPRGTGSDGVLEPSLVAFLVAEKLADPRASVPELLRRAVAVGLLANAREVDRTTAWRVLRRRAVGTRRRRKEHDQRRFSKAHRNELVLCDGKHFRAGPTRAKRVALFFIDDATRYIPEVVVGTSETAELFLRGLHRLLRAVGRIDAIYIDHGSGFTAHDSREVVANLDFAHILGEVAYPQARGKVERFNLTAEEDLLRHLAQDSVDADPTALELRIAHYLRTDYNVRAHESLAKGETPRSRFLADARPLEPYDDADALRSHFFVSLTRRVTNDHVISVGSRHWEMPRGLARQQISVRQDVFDPTHLLLEHKGRVLRLCEVDLVANADGRRGRSVAPEAVATTSKSAAVLAADAALAPITEPDGGFVVTEDERD